MCHLAGILRALSRKRSGSYFSRNIVRLMDVILRLDFTASGKSTPLFEIIGPRLLACLVIDAVAVCTQNSVAGCLAHRVEDGSRRGANDPGEHDERRVDA